MKSFIVFVALTVAFGADSALSSTGSVLGWRQVSISADDEISLTASMDRAGHLLQLKVWKSGKAYQIPNSVYCLNYTYYLNSVSIISNSYHPAFSDLSITFRTNSKQEVGDQEVVELFSDGRNFTHYSVSIYSEDGSVQVPVPYRPLDACASN